MESKQHTEYIVIIGCGRLGASIANALSNQNRNVTIIDKNKESFRKLSHSFSGLAMEGDAMELEILKEARIEEATSLVIVTNKDNINIMVGQLAKNIYQTDKVIIRLYDPERECICENMHLNTIFPSLLSENEVDKIMMVRE